MSIVSTFNVRINSKSFPWAVCCIPERDLPKFSATSVVRCYPIVRCSACAAQGHGYGQRGKITRNVMVWSSSLGGGTSRVHRERSLYCLTRVVSCQTWSAVSRRFKHSYPTSPVQSSTKHTCRPSGVTSCQGDRSNPFCYRCRFHLFIYSLLCIE